jgi:hypothetical protein
MKGAEHALGDVPAEGAQATRQRAPGLRLAFFNLLADLEGGSTQVLQLLFFLNKNRGAKPPGNENKITIKD